jgi:deazaflavin-dependent oxidoreductase (nitroreductase family)
MSEKNSSIPVPRGIMAWLLRLPVGLYRAHLGFLLGERFLMLSHTGRKTGRLHRSVIEIVDHDKASDTYYAVSGWGEKSNWYRNIMANPRVTVQVKNRIFQSDAQRVSPDVGAQVLVDYARKHPFALREIAGIMKYPLDGSEADVINLGRTVPVIAFKADSPEK